jgi:hypothetical protein
MSEIMTIAGQQDPLTFLADLVFGIYGYLLDALFYFQIGFTFVLAGLAFLAVRKAAGLALPETKNELGIVAAIVVGYIVWTQIFASLILTGAALIVFYIFGGAIFAFAAFMATILK